MSSSSPLANPKESRQLRQFRQPPELEKYLFSEEIFLVLQKLAKYDYEVVISVSSKQLKEACMKEIRRLQSVKLKEKIAKNIYLDSELSAIVMQNQIRALIELQKINEDNMKKYASPTRKKQPNEADQSRDSIIVRRYEGIYNEIQKNEGEVKHFMQAEVLNRPDIDFKSCYTFFKLQTKKLKKNSNEKMILSRAQLLDAFSYLLGEALKKMRIENEPSHDDEEEQGLSEEDLIDQNGPNEELSYQQINKWKRMASRIIEQKLVQLAGICEQIPQLETFNRTLQFSQLQNRQKIMFLRIVDVLISLHHRVSYLSRNKPQLLRELQHAQEQLQSLNNSCETFLLQLEQEISEITPIIFTGEVKKHNQLSESFLLLRRHIIKMSEVIVSQDQFHTDNFDRTDRIVQLISLYLKAFTGHSQFSEEWEQLIQQVSHERDQEQVPEDEYQIIMQLQECMLEYQNKVILLQQLEQQSNTKTNEELEEEVNKLISDFERLKDENRQHIENLNLLSKLREELEMEIEERDNMIYNLSGVKVALEKKLASHEGVTHHSNRIIEDDLKKQQYETQKYLQSSLLLRQQLKVSENEREKLLQLIQTQKEKYLKLFESLSRIKPQKERLEIENEQLLEKIQKIKNEQVRQTNKLNKQINDITNQRDLLQLQLKTAEGNNAKLMERLESNEKRIAEYSAKMAFVKYDEREPSRAQKEQKSQELGRLQDEIERYRRQLERGRKELENRRIEIEMVEQENSTFKQQITILKSKVKDIRISQEEGQQKDELIKQLRAKLEKNTAKINNLQKENSDIRDQQEQTQAKSKQAVRRIKQLEAKLSQLQIENTRLTFDLQQRSSHNIDIQKNANTQSNQYNTEIKFYKDLTAKQEQELKEKSLKLQSLQRKIERLESQLAIKTQKGEESVKEIVELKVKQYESTIETHKLIEVKLEEQTITLKSKLEEKIQVEGKLNLQIDRLSKEIDRMKDQLERYIRELTEKEIVIKKQRQHYEQQVKIIREYEIRQKVYNDNQTPVKPTTENKRSREVETPSHIEDRENSNRKRPSQDSNNNNNNNSESILDNSISKQNGKYDLYYSPKQYERLLKEYNDFKTSISIKIEQLEKNLEMARNAKIDLETKLKNSQLENKRIANGKNINISDTESLENKKKTEGLESKLQESNSLLLQYQQKIKNLNDLTDQLQEKNKILLAQLAELKNKMRQKDEFVQKNSSERVTKLEIIIANLEKANDNLKRQSKDSLNTNKEIEQLKRDKQLLENQLRQAKTIINDFNASISGANKSQVDQFKQTIQSLNEEINKIISEKSKNDENNAQFVKQRDQIRKQHDEMRKHLVQQTRRAVYLESEIAKYKEELRGKEGLVIEVDDARRKIQQLESQLETLRIELKAEKERSKSDSRDVNVEYYLEKIRSLQEALASIEDQYNQCKQALKQRNEANNTSNINSGRDLQKMLEDNQRLFGDNQFLTQINMQQNIQIQDLLRCEQEWISKERIYLQELQSISRQNVSLKDLMGKPSEKHVVTGLPNRINPVNVNYHDISSEEIKRDNSQSIEETIYQMDLAIEGRTRWEGTRLLESLQRWRVPLIVCKEIEELLNYLAQVIELVKFLRMDYLSLRSSNSDSLLFENMLEYSFRILVYFSEIEAGSAEANNIRAQIHDISSKYAGGLFFTVLQQFTIHILENNAIEEYKRELRAKAKELLLIKQKLDELITRQIQQEENIINRPHSHRSRDTTPYRESLSASPKPIK